MVITTPPNGITSISHESGFLDTVGLIAVWDKADQWHEQEKPMTKVLRGIVHGKTIEVTEDIAMWEGQAVNLLVTPSDSHEPLAESSPSTITPKKLPGPRRLEARPTK